MITLVSKEPVPYVATFDRDRTPQTVFWLTPMTSEESANYRARWKHAQEEYNVPLARRAANAVRVDREALAGQLTRCENLVTEGDDVDGEELVRLIADGFDFAVLQELMVAAQNMSMLEAGRKKS